MADDRVGKLMEKGHAAFNRQDFKSAYDYLEEPTRKSMPLALLERGAILLHGWLGEKPDLDRAYKYYERASVSNVSNVRCEGYLGCVRALLAKGDPANAEKAIRFCKAASEGVRPDIALLLLGRVFEELYQPPDYARAKEAYLAAFRRGAAWGMRRYARALWSSGNKFGGALAHVGATIAAPLYLLLRGMRAGRQG